MSTNKFIELRRLAEKIKDNSDYDFRNAECNPKIFRKFVGEIIDRHIDPRIIWEPFAGHTVKSKNLDFAQSLGVYLVAYDLQPIDDRVLKMDSTVQAPDIEVGGVFYHPPYFGSAPQSDSEEDLSRIEDWKKYVCTLRKSIKLACNVLASNGLVCAIGRDYRVKGNRIRLDLEYVRLFESNGLRLERVMTSEPDVILWFRKD